jgi:hypothetical protein
MKFGTLLSRAFWAILGQFGFAPSSTREDDSLPEPSELDEVFSTRPKSEVPDSISLRSVDLGSSEPEKPVPPSGPAPEAAPVKPSESFRPEPAPRMQQHPILQRLRRRAFNQLFDHFGLSMIPAEAWFALDRSNDPVAAFRSFAMQIGCEPERVRRSDAQQLARMQTAIDLLVGLHAIRGHLSANGGVHIQASLRSSTDAQLAEHASLVELLAGIQSDRLRAEGFRPCTLYEKFLSTVSELCQDPLAALVADVEEASVISERLLQSMLHYSNTRAQIESISEHIDLIWSEYGAGSDEDMDILDGILVISEELDTKLSNDDSLVITDIERMADECVAMFRVLNDVYSRYADVSDATSHDSGGVNEFEEALRFFGFPLDSSPSDIEIRKVFHEMWKEHNVDDPSHRETETQKLENERILKELNKYYAVLRPKKAA